jgi:hypothetical protein
MDLYSAANFFDRLVCRDAYGERTFRAQLGVYDDATWDGPGSVRRMLSVSPRVQIPPRGAIVAGDKTWLVVESHPDFFRHRTIRVKYTLHQSDGLAHLKTFAECIDGKPGHAAFAARTYVRSAKEGEISSGLYTVYELFLTRSEADKLPDPGVGELAGQDFILHDPYFTEGGFLAARVTQLPKLRATALYRRRLYQPVSDSWAEGERAIPVLCLRWQEHFQYLARYDVKYAAGDAQVILKKTDAPCLIVGDQLEINDRTFSVAAKYGEGEVWSAHGRPV